MEKGTYYSTDEVGAELWRLIEAGCNIAEIFDVLQAQYEAGADEIMNTISTFVARLTDEGLLVKDDSPRDTHRPPVPLPDVRRSFRPPVLHTYRDMQDMLSLDPIHDVEAAGWPVPKLEEDPAATPKSA